MHMCNQFSCRIAITWRVLSNCHLPVIAIGDKNGCSWHFGFFWSGSGRLDRVYRPIFILFHRQWHKWEYQKVHHFDELLWASNLSYYEEFSVFRPINWFHRAQLVEKVRIHREPKSSTSLQRFQFNSRTRAPDESVADYVAELQRLAEHCAYSEMLEEMLRDRLVCDINNGAIQRHLLAELDLTLMTAIAVVQAAEIADTEVKELQASIAGVSIVSTTDNKDVYKCTSEYPAWTKNNANRGTDCYRCGAKHNVDQCHFKSVNCHACGKLGHIATVCRTKKKF